MSTSFTDVSTLPLLRLFANILAPRAFRCIRVGGALLVGAALVACGQSADTPETAEPAVVVSPNDDRAYNLIELAKSAGLRKNSARVVTGDLMIALAGVRGLAHGPRRSASSGARRKEEIGKLAYVNVLTRILRFF